MVSRAYTGKSNLFRYEKQKLPAKDTVIGALVMLATISIVLVDAFVLPNVHFLIFY